MSKKDIYLYWLNLAETYSLEKKKIKTCYDEIVDYYTKKSRKYHTLDHIEHLLNLTMAYGHRLEYVDIVRFSVFYHDIIYKASRSDNEEKSAKLAMKRMARLNVPDETAKLVEHFILCTKNHEPQPCVLQNDLHYFLDFDLSILGSRDPDVYHAYTRAIRREYKMYPDFLYRQGRKKVIQHFLRKEKIFLTADFQEAFEEPARKNLKKELETL